MNKLLCILLGVAVNSATWAAPTCKYEDADGHVIYANVPIKNARKVQCFGTESQALPSSPDERPRKALTSPQNFPKVDTPTQKQRDNKRMQILEEELANEKKALEQAQKALVDGEASPEVYRTKDGKTKRNMAKYTEKLQTLQADVTLHEKNIQLLEKELSSLK